MKILVEQSCPGMEAVEDCVRQEIPGVPETRVLIDIFAAKVHCDNLFATNLCIKPERENLPLKEGRSSFRVGCRYLFPPGTAWKDKDGKMVSDIAVVVPATKLG